jgi:antitoxin component YwqK of YwqJK toxin-antitoxin module
MNIINSNIIIIVIISSTALSCKSGVERKNLYENGQVKEIYYEVEDSKGNFVKTGTHTTWYRNGRIESEKEYDDGKRDGESNKWYENGQKAYEMTFSNGKEDGVSKSWYSNGILKSKKEYDNDVPLGTHSEWHENGKLKSIIKYEDGLASGYQHEWNENGVLIKQTEFNKGLKEGVCLEFYDDGQKAVESLYKNGIENGLRTAWYPNGSLKFKGTVIDSIINGSCISLKENRDTNYIGTFNNGKFTGWEYTYYNNNHLAMKQWMNLSTKDSTLHLWYTNGSYCGSMILRNGLPNQYETILIGTWDWKFTNDNNITFRNDGSWTGNFFDRKLWERKSQYFKQYSGRWELKGNLLKAYDQSNKELISWSILDINTTEMKVPLDTNGRSLSFYRR